MVTIPSARWRALPDPHQVPPVNLFFFPKMWVEVKKTNLLMVAMGGLDFGVIAESISSTGHSA
jgi:hypothetical protein